MIIRKNLYRILVAALLLCSVLISQAKAGVSTKTGEGGLVGNGGGLVVCYDSASQITSTETLDLYEARTLRNLDLDKSIPTNLSWKDTAKFIIQKIGKISEMRRQLYGFWLERFEADAKFISNVDLGDVRDAQFIAIPKGCKMETAVIQAKPRMTGDKRYIVNQDLWNKLSELQKAALVMHELIYHEAIAYGHTNSIQVRIFNAFAFTSSFDGMNSYDVVKYFRERKFEYTDIPTKKIADFTFTAPMLRLWNISDSEIVNGELPKVVLNNRVIGILGKCNENCNDFTAFKMPIYMAGPELADYVEMMNDEYSIKVNGILEEARFGGCDADCNPYESYQKVKDLCMAYSSDGLTLSLVACHLESDIYKQKSLLDSVVLYKNYVDHFMSVNHLQNAPKDSSQVKSIQLNTAEILGIEGQTFNFTHNDLIKSGDELYLQQLGVSNFENYNVFAYWIFSSERQHPSIGCRVVPTASDFCFLYLLNTTNKGMNYFEIHSADVIALDGYGRYSYGGTTNILGSIKTESDFFCPDHSYCIELVRDYSSDEFILNISKDLNVDFNGIFTDPNHARATSPYYKIKANGYPAYKNGFPKWGLLIGNFFCSLISNNYERILEDGDVIYYHSDSSIDLEKTCGAMSTQVNTKALLKNNLEKINSIKGVF